MITGLGIFNHEWNVESIRYMIKVFVERCMFASNSPVDSLYSDHDTHFEPFSCIVNYLKAHEKICFFRNGAIHFWEQ
jgi:predicted TIM-barrel fold metal-dependent hydrolase